MRTAGLFYYMQRIAHGAYNEWALEAERHARFDQFNPPNGRAIMERIRRHETRRRIRHPDEIIPAWLVLSLRGRECPEFCGGYDRNPYAPRD
jgi:hypothetical protein